MFVHGSMECWQISHTNSCGEARIPRIRKRTAPIKGTKGQQTLGNVQIGNEGLLEDRLTEERALRNLSEQKLHNHREFAHLFMDINVLFGGCAKSVE